MAPRRRVRNSRAVRRGTPQIFVAEQSSIPTADTATNVTVFTNAEEQPYLFTHKTPVFAADVSADMLVMAVIRRVPNGYSAPTSVPISTGSSSFIDERDVLSYGFLLERAGSTDHPNFRFTMLRSGVRLEKGDAVVLQLIPSATSASATCSVVLEYKTSGM